jgi:hypothetical protein
MSWASMKRWMKGSQIEWRNAPKGASSRCLHVALSISPSGSRVARLGGPQHWHAIFGNAVSANRDEEMRAFLSGAGWANAVVEPPGDASQDATPD